MKEKRVIFPILVAFVVLILVAGNGTDTSKKTVISSEASNAAISSQVESTDSIEETSAAVTQAASATQTESVAVSSESVSCDIATVQGKMLTYAGKTYKIIQVDGGDMSGSREANVAVDIGYGDRVYWGLTNEYGQLVYALADKVTLQDSKTESVKSNGRYYDDEADVPGTEQKDLDKGHVIADSLGGVSNAYNITPEDSTLNRHGDQAYMEKVLRDAGGCTDLVATITYPDTTTQIPSKYRFEYLLNGNKVVDEFDNKNPEAKSSSTSTEKAVTKKSSAGSTAASTPTDESSELAKVDTNGDGKVTIKEAKAAGYKMPITSNDWLYKYMKDADGDGKVGE